MSELPASNASEVLDSIESSFEANSETPAEQSAKSAVEGIGAADGKSVGNAVKEVEKAILKKKLKLKVDGEEFEEEFDPNDDEYLKKQLQLAKVSQKRMSESAQLQKEVRDFFELLKTNPKKVLQDPNIGIDLKQLAASIIEEEIENAKKSPEQIEREKLQEEIRRMKEEREQELESNKSRELRRLEQQEAERYDTQFTKALETGNLPKTPYVVKKMADYMLLGLQEGLDITPDDVVQLVKEEMNSDIKQMFSSMPDEIIEQLIGSEKINSIRKRKVANAKKAPTPMSKLVKDTGASSEIKSSEPKAKMNYKKFFGV